MTCSLAAGAAGPAGAAGAGPGRDFNSWLGQRLRELPADEAVYTEYITGLLLTEDEPREIRQALTDLLADILVKEDDINRNVDDIIQKWQSFKQSEEEEAAAKVEDVEERLVKLMGSQALIASAPKQYTDDEKKIREAILSQYSQLSDNEDAASGASGTEGDGDLVRNTNAATVAAAARERRAQAQLESQRKKEKDKEDRAKQKQLKEEKKEKRKTQKNERKR